VADLARSGGNVTGLTSISAHLSGKRLELLKELVPRASLIAVIHNPADLSNVLIVREMREAAPRLGLGLLLLEVQGPNDFEGAFAAMKREGAQALFGVPGVLTFAHQNAIVSLAAKSELPAKWGIVNLSMRAVSCHTPGIFTSRCAAPRTMSTRSSRAQSPQAFRLSRRRHSSSLSISRQRNLSALSFRRNYWRRPTR
jgi:hypothetical protein